MRRTVHAHTLKRKKKQIMKLYYHLLKLIPSVAKLVFVLAGQFTELSLVARCQYTRTEEQLSVEGDAEDETPGAAAGERVQGPDVAFAEGGSKSLVYARGCRVGRAASHGRGGSPARMYVRYIYIYFSPLFVRRRLKSRTKVLEARD